MNHFLSGFLVPAAVTVVAVVLLFGLFNMMRGGRPQLSQKLMRARVLLQALAIGIIMVAVYAQSHLQGP